MRSNVFNLVGKYLFFILAALFAVAVFLREDFVFTLIYLLAGTFFLSRWWGQRAFNSLSIERRITPRMYLGEKARCRVRIRNHNWLPLPWLQVHESLPPELSAPKAYRAVVPLRSKGDFKFEYWLEGRRRGYYAIGPLTLYSGDIFGALDQSRRSYPAQYLTVFPKIIHLTNVPLPSRSPLGTLRHTQPVYEDPSRVIGKRDYTSGDSLRRIDWKASAASGRLQVKNYEPSIELQTQIILNLHASEYDARRRFDDSELAIVVAASLANWISAKRQSVGLATNGSDPLEANGRIPVLMSRSGRGHLLRILEVLARVQCKETYPFLDLLLQQRLHMPWGTTQVLVSPSIDDA
ncbi:MAG: DUF58 domain-containing protein, partial [Anaerolineales bacterium]